MKLLQSPSKEPVKKILCRHFKKENNYAIPKNLQFGEWKPVRDTSLPASTLAMVSTSNPSQKVAMLDAEVSKSKKIFEKKKHL